MLGCQDPILFVVKSSRPTPACQFVQSEPRCPHMLGAWKEVGNHYSQAVGVFGLVCVRDPANNTEERVKPFATCQRCSQTQDPVVASNNCANVQG